MPSIITHHLFGQDASTLLPEGMLVTQEELIAFLLGNQGTNPLSARFACMPRRARNCHEFARAAHRDSMVTMLCSLRSAVTNLPACDIPLGKAFVLGMAAHYLLDSVTHPLILALVRQLVESDSTLEGAEAALHALIEADIDSWLIWQKRHKTILEAPAQDALVSTNHIDRISSALMAQVSDEVFGMRLNASEYAKAVRDYRIIYRCIDPPSQNLPRALRELGLLRRRYSRIEAWRHLVITSDDCASANLNRHPWRNPFTGELSTASFADLFHDALNAWPVFCKRLVEGDHLRLAAMVDGINYYGEPVAI